MIIVESAEDAAEASLCGSPQPIALSPVEIADACARLMDSKGCTPDELAAEVGRPVEFVRDHLRLLRLPKKTRETIEDEELTLADALSLVDMSPAERKAELKQLVARMTEARASSPSPDSAESAYGLADLIDAYLDHQQWKNAHPDLAGYYDARYQAFKRAFAVDLDALPSESSEEQAFGIAFKDALRCYGRTGSPFDGWMEAPPKFTELCDPHHRVLADLAHETRQALVDLMRDLLIALEPNLRERRVASEALRALGFDDQQPKPDLCDYF